MPIKKRQFLGVPFNGIIHQKAQRVDLANTRGIIFDRPERYVVNTPTGQLEISQGDWLVEFQPSRHYVIKDADIGALTPQRRRWRLW